MAKSKNKKNKDTIVEAEVVEIKDDVKKQVKSKKENNLDIKFNLNKNHINLIILGAILFLGFYLRMYHMDYPVVGYHNWKETHYLTEARNFERDGFFKYGFFVPAYDLLGTNDDKSGVHPDTFPIISIILALFFKAFGTSLVVARFVGILFSMGTVAFTYLFVKRIFKREDIALVAAAVATMNPLLIFFSHNTQLVNPGIFFMMVSAYFFAGFIENYNSKDLILTSIFATLSALAKYPFLLIGIPMFFVFGIRIIKSPTKMFAKLKDKWGVFLISAMILSSVFIWISYSDTVREKYIGKGSESEAKLTDLIKLEIFKDPNFWPAIKSYTRDNFTFEGIYLAIVGFIFITLFYNKSVGNAFTFWYFIGSIFWFIIMSFKLSGHNYHMFPIAPLFFILVGYLFTVIGSNLGKLVKNDIVKWVFIAIALIWLFNISKPSWERMYDTQFIGLDVAGEYINAHSTPDELIYHSSHQSFGVLWHADRKGIKPASLLETFKRVEDRGINWYFVYQWQFPKLFNNPEIWEHVQSSYSLKQMAYTMQNDQPNLLYMLFKKEGSFDGSDITKLVQNFTSINEVTTKEYELTKGKQVLYVVSE